MKLSFSKEEYNHLLKALLGVSIAFTLFEGESPLSIFMVWSALTIGAGFLLHELAHKFVAQKYGASAEFKAQNGMLIGGILLSIFGILFLAPGAVHIQGRTIGRSRAGKIAAAGPVTNFILALIFLSLPFPFSHLGAKINAWLGLFNLLPFSPFDGEKIRQWNLPVLITLLIVGVAILFFTGQ